MLAIQGKLCEWRSCRLVHRRIRFFEDAIELGGAAHALATYPTEINRVAVFDFDVHHGNGSAEQTVLRNLERSARSEPQDMLYISTHQHPYYPGTGESQTVGGVSLLPDDLKQLGVLNLPLSAASGGDSSSQQFRQAVEGSVLPFFPLRVKIEYRSAIERVAGVPFSA